MLKMHKNVMICLGITEFKAYRIDLELKNGQHSKCTFQLFLVKMKQLKVKVASVGVSLNSRDEM